MTIIRLNRAYLPHGTYGTLELPEGSVLKTVERSWKGNEPFTSCIQEGVYTCKRVNSPKFGNTFEVIGVPGRSHILFHVANIPSDVEGCFGVCMGRPIYFNKEWGYSQSADGMAFFRQVLKGIDEFTLVIGVKKGG